MKDQLSHTEIDRIIDEQEREMDLLIHESYSKDREETAANGARKPKSPGLMKRVRSAWQKVFRR